MHLLRSLFLVGVVLTTSALALSPRDDHGPHHAGGTPKLELNETALALIHGITPPSYYTEDWDDPIVASERHPGLMVAHGLFMCLAFFVFLPIGMALRSVKHPLHRLAVLAQWICTILSLAYASLYRKLTPDMYPGQAHSKHGYIVLLIGLGITSIDFAALLRRILSFVRAGQFTLQALSDALKGAHGAAASSDTTELEYVGLMDEDERAKTAESEEEQWATYRDMHAHSSASDVPASRASDDTLHDHDPDHHAVRIQPRMHRSRLHRALKAAFTTAEWILLFGGFTTLLSGIVVYTGASFLLGFSSVWPFAHISIGGCREKFLPGCLAHLIKGGIFWSYGLLTFARFLGFCAELGWAWNRSPSTTPSAEWVESFVIFLYGVTNTWMERFGAAPGSPYTTKNIQHIGIDVMFWFAGLLGMAVESRRLRRWLAFNDASASELDSGAEEDYTPSFNPFPALVIGVTGSAISAHWQEYLFQVQIHSLWGALLLSFAILRCMTYIFLWIRPANSNSTRPSRPPSEALASFFLAAGGLSFMFSTEEVTVAAMRRGRDDIMLFVVLAVSITCIAFVWTVGVVGFQGWLKMKMNSNLSTRRGKVAF